MKPTFTDDRGTITDVLLEHVDAVTHITFTEGAVRGNHFHRKTIQYDYVLYGELMLVTKKYPSAKQDDAEIIRPGTLITHKRGTAHAYKALTDACILSMTRGPRRGPSYECDTYRLKKPLL